MVHLSSEPYVRRLLIGLELLALLIFVYLALALNWHLATHVLIGMQLAVSALGCAIVVSGAMRRKAWAPKAAIVVAAFAGLPNISTIGQLTQLIHSSGPGAELSVSILLVATALQCAAFVIGLCLLSGVPAV